MKDAMKVMIPAFCRSVMLFRLSNILISATLGESARILFSSYGFKEEYLLLADTSEPESFNLR